MKKIIFFFLTSVFILSANAQQWAKSYTGSEGTSTSFYNTIYNTVCDSQGNTYNKLKISIKPKLQRHITKHQSKIT